VSILVNCPEAWPIYDDHDVLTHFGGIALKQECQAYDEGLAA
jgi:hypothetical protein